MKKLMIIWLAFVTLASFTERGPGPGVPVRKDGQFGKLIANKTFFQQSHDYHYNWFGITNDSTTMITYDTMIVYRYDPYHTTNYYLRITRPLYLFTAGNRDTASRQAIITMPGVGEMGHDTTKLVDYGPHYWLNNGWNGGVQLGNGEHFPILVTMIADVSPPDPPPAGNLWIVNYLINNYHIKHRGVHVAGLSEGAFTWGYVIGVTDTTGTGMTGADVGSRLITSVALLSGAASTSGNYKEFGHWASAYGGRLFATVGYADAQAPNVPPVTQNMNDSAPGSAAFAYNTQGSGSHCCWNTDYDPTVTNWNPVTSPTGTYVTTSTAPNTQGSYYAPSSLFQWELRQGDTSFAYSTPPLSIVKVATAEYVTGYIASDSNLYAYWNGSTTPALLALPGSRKVADAYCGFNNFNAVAYDGTKWTSSYYNSGGSIVWTQTVTDTLGTAITNAQKVWAWASGTVILRADGTGWLDNNDTMGIIHSLGTQYIITKPIQFTQTGVTYQKFQIGTIGIVGLTTDGRVFLWAYNQNSKTPTQITSTRKLLDVATAGFNSITGIMRSATGDTTKGTIVAYGNAWGTWGASTSASYSSFTDISSLWPGTYSQVNMSTNVMTAISSTGQLWSAGYNPIGEVGNGQEAVNKYYYPTFPNYGYDFGNYEYPVAPPQAITSGIVFTQLYTNPFFGLYKYAKDTLGNIYSWGANKSGVLGNGILPNPLDSTNQYHRNCCDILSPTIVTPLGQTLTSVTFHAPSISAGSNQSIGTSTATLSASGRSVANVNIANTADTVCCAITGWSWTQTSGPNTATIASASSKSTAISGLVNGTYHFQVMSTDANTGQDTAGLNVVVNITTPPTVSAGSNQSITLPTNSVTLAGSASANSPATSISTYAWTQVSGPNTGTFSSTTITGPTFSGLIAGTYVLKLTATDNLGGTNNATVNIVVNSGSAPCNCFTSFGKIISH